MDILLIGCGRMGRAMLNGWLAQGHITRIDVVDPHVANLPAHDKIHSDKVHGFETIGAWAQAGVRVDMVVLAIKPQKMQDAAQDIRAALTPDVPLLSIVTGFGLARLASLFGEGRGYIRAMPNTPAAIGRGVTGYVSDDKIKPEQLDKAVSLIDTLGVSVPLVHEEQIEALTAISGSGPAYYYLFTEALAQSATALGLPADVGALLARQTFIGAAALLDSQNQDTPATLRAMVTSPGGTTQAATEAFQTGDALQKLTNSATKAAMERAIILGKNT